MEKKRNSGTDRALVRLELRGRVFAIPCAPGRESSLRSVWRTVQGVLDSLVPSGRAVEYKDLLVALLLLADRLKQQAEASEKVGAEYAGALARMRRTDELISGPMDRLERKIKALKRDVEDLTEKGAKGEEDLS